MFRNRGRPQKEKRHPGRRPFSRRPPERCPFSRRHPGRRALSLSLDVIPDGAQRRAGIQTGAPQGRLDPRLALRAPGDDSKKKTSPRTTRPLSLDVIPDGAQRRTGIQTGAPQGRLDPGLRLRRPRDDGKKAKRHPRRHPLSLDVPLTMSSLSPSSRMARFFDVILAGAPPLLDVIPDGAQRRAGIQRALRKNDWIPGSHCARPGMTAKSKSTPQCRIARYTPPA